jgi:hypothetical protein
MTTTSFKMSRRSVACLFFAVIVSTIVLISCQKDDNPVINNLKEKPSSYSSDILDKWMTMQLRFMRNAIGIPNQAFSRYFAYSGVAAFESLKPGMNHQTSEWSDKWNGLTGLPVPAQAKKYYLPANVNAAMAAINRAMFPNANAADKAAIDSLEAVLNIEFLNTQPAGIIATSANFGKAIAAAVFNWSEHDGYKNANAPYTIPVGEGKWKPTPPAFANPSTPYWGNNKTIIKGTTNNCQLNYPTQYSTEPSSAFYAMVKEVYDASLVLTDDQKAMAIFWRDVPGVTSPGHWLSILQQVIKQTESSLEKAALAYALTGAACNDALIICLDGKYEYSVVRPITYIREVMGYTTWNSFLTTPAHPEYSSAHSSLSMASARVLERLFGAVGSFTDHTYDYLGFAPRTYSSFADIAAEAGLSRLYAGIHYRKSIEAGLLQGDKVAINIFSKNIPKEAKTNYNFK